MTEQEWCNSASPDLLLNWLADSDRNRRKFLLFIGANCRLVAELLGEKHHALLEAWDCVADGILLFDECWKMFIASGQIEPMGALEAAAGKVLNSALGHLLANSFPGQFERSRLRGPTEHPPSLAALDWHDIRHAATLSLRAWSVLHPSSSEKQILAERKAQCDLLRELCGNPFRPVRLESEWLSWRDRTPVKVARSIYEERRFRDLPVLADALEEAGCQQEELLRHCRQGGEHVRGCWAVDTILG